MELIFDDGCGCRFGCLLQCGVGSPKARMLRVYEGLKITKTGEYALARNGKQMEGILREEYQGMEDCPVGKPWLTRAGKWDGCEV